MFWPQKEKEKKKIYCRIAMIVLLEIGVTIKKIIIIFNLFLKKIIVVDLVPCKRKEGHQLTSYVSFSVS